MYVIKALPPGQCYAKALGCGITQNEAEAYVFPSLVEAQDFLALLGRTATLHWEIVHIDPDIQECA